MIFYHGTSEEHWEKIQKEGVLWGYNTHKDENGRSHKGYRYTYLTPDLEVAKKFSDVVLEIEYEPVGIDGREIDNYGFGPPEGQTCWQFSVFVPIPSENVKRLEILKN